MDAVTLDPVMAKIREIWTAKQSAGWTLGRLGEAMGYEPDQAKQAAHQFLRGRDPRVSSVKRFAAAVGVSPATLLRG
jgi:hypothetical protein